MKREILLLICCPNCRGTLALDTQAESCSELREGTLVCSTCGASFDVTRSVPRFVTRENYSMSFGFQWNRFRRTQMDSYSGVSISRDRFFRQSGWTASDLAGKSVLDVGCGAGRFAEIALSAGAFVTAVDYSTAVDACWANLGPHPRLYVVQADVYQLPFHPASFDYVYCFGVLQHTPDVKRAFRCLAQQLRPGGRIVVDLYPASVWNVLWPKYWLRPLTKRVPAERLFPAVERMVALLWPVSLALGRVPLIGRKLRYGIPVVNYEGVLPLTPMQLREWALLDTFDMLAPAHDHPQSMQTLRRWFEEAGLQDIEVFRSGLCVGRGAAPAAG